MDGSPRPIGIIANPVSGKDIRRLVANAATSTLQEKYTIVRRVVIGAAEVGANRFEFLAEPHHICERAVETLDLGLDWHEVDIDARYDESDTVRTVAKMREIGCAAIVTLGGDGTNRAATIGWPDVPLVPISTGTNNVFPDFVEATVAGAAAGLIAAGRVELGEVSLRAKIVEVEVEGEEPDLALIDAVLVKERFVGSRALFDPTALSAALLTRAEPASVGISSIGGLLHPCGALDPGGVALRFADETDATLRLRAPLAPGLYTDVNLASAEPIGEGVEMEMVGPGLLAFDGERQRALADGQVAKLRVVRKGPRVIDPGRALRLAAERESYVGSREN